LCIVHTSGGKLAPVHAFEGVQGDWRCCSSHS